MKKINLISLFILQFFFLLSILRSEGQMVVTGKVIDESDLSIPQAEVMIEGNSPITTNLEGRFQFTPVSDLIVPFDVKVIKKGYKVSKFFYDDNNNFLEIILTGTKEEKIEKEVIVHVVDLNKNPIPFISININHQSYTTDKEGNLLVKGNFNERSKINQAGYRLAGVSQEKVNNSYVVTLSPIEVAVVVPEIPLTKAELNLSVFEKYKSYFNKLAQELMAEKQRIETMNQRIREELLIITNKLENETNLTAAQKKVLKEQTYKLEKQIEDNALTYQKSAQRTGLLILTLKGVILEKDSITTLADKKVALALKNELISRKKTQRNLLIFSIITAAFIIFGVVFYLTYLKIRNQRTKLQAANKEINKIKNQLAKNVLELKESNEQMEIFVYKASHDIKGPLRSIIGLTTIGREDVKDPVALNYFEHILLSTQKLDKLLLDLLQVTKVKQATINYEPIDFRELVEDSISSFKHLPGFERIKLNIHIEDDLNFESDKKILQSIIQNLIENPIKYQDEQKQQSYLNIDIVADEKGAKMVFSDNGLGIPSEMKDKVFEMFYKVNENSNGTGLGLYIVKTSVEKLNGTIVLDSSIGTGTTFTVEFES